MVPYLHFIWFWWTPPKLGDAMERDLAEVVRWFGKGYFFQSMRNDANKLIQPQAVLYGGADLRLADRRDKPLWFWFLKSVWRSTLDKVCLCLTISLLVGSALYVGDPELLLYAGPCIFLFLGVYFGTLAFSLTRYSHWLDELVRKRGDR